MGYRYLEISYLVLVFAVCVIAIVNYYSAAVYTNKDVTESNPRNTSQTNLNNASLALFVVTLLSFLIELGKFFFGHKYEL